MTKLSPRLTNVQAKALDFIRTSFESRGTSPTLREVCAYMGYSAIGSAQDLISALRRKGFLHTPDKQSARSLVLTPKAIAMHEPSHQSTNDTYVMHCLDQLPSEQMNRDATSRLGTLRMSIGMFKRPYPLPQDLFALKCQDNLMSEWGIMQDDWLIVHKQQNPTCGSIVVVPFKDSYIVRVLHKDRLGYFLKTSQSDSEIIRQKSDLKNGNDCFTNIFGQVLGVQRIVS